MDTASPHELHRLLAETRWIRGLARSLVADPHAADDLAQDACVVALDRPPQCAGNVRAWLGVVMRNLLLQQSRAAARRRRRESEADCGRERAFAASAATDELVDRANAQRRVVDAVLALAPPYRDTVLLRYFEDIPPRAIAQRLGVPVATVHSRLQRAHAQLRRTLDAQFGERTRWQRAFLPLPLPMLAGSLTPPTILLAMNTKLLAAAAAVLLGSAALWMRSGSGATTDATPRNAGTVAADAGVAPVAAAPATPDTVADRSAVVVAPPPTRAASPAVADASRRCSGRVVDADGRPVPQVHVRVGDARTVTDRAGAFEAVAGVAELVVRADEPGWCTILEGHVRRGDDAPPVLVVVAPALRLAGHVRSSRGEALVAASVRVVLPSDLRSRLSDVVDAAVEARLVADAGADGAFHLDAGRVRGAELLTVADGCAPDRRPLPTVDDAHLTIVLERLDGIAGTVRGQIVDPHGRAVAGARVGLGPAMVKSDELGNFAVEDDGEARELCASAAGHRRGVLPRGQGFAPFVVLTLGEPPLAIRGSVVDETGAGVADAVVWADDPTLLCTSNDPIAVEGVASGYCTMRELRERFERGEFAGQQPDQVRRANPTADWPWVNTGADGSFVLGGLEDRPYRVRALDRDTLLMTEVGDVPAGRRDVRIVLDRSQLFAEVAGVVVSHDGSPVPGATLTVQIDAQSLQGRTIHQRAVATAKTDGEGRFRLPRVPKARAYFRIDGDQILPSEPGRGLPGGILDLSGGRPDALRLEVHLRVHVQVELLDPDSADTIEVLDGAGESVALTVFDGRGRRNSDRLQLTEGRSPVFAVPDTARTLVLKKGDRTIARHALQLVGREVNTLRF